MNESQNLQEKVNLTESDRQILIELQRNGRMSNAELANRVGLAPSTCLARTRNLIEQGVIRGFHAQIEPRALGLDLEVLISVTMRAGARQRITEVADDIRSNPEVTQLFYLGGEEDFIVHMLARDSDHVRRFVTENLSEHPAVSSTRTSIVFMHTQQSVAITP